LGVFHLSPRGLGRISFAPLSCEERGGLSGRESFRYALAAFSISLQTSRGRRITSSLANLKTLMPN
jgi:hypothetical protein